MLSINEIVSIWYDRDTSPKNLSKRDWKKFVGWFFLTISWNKVNGDHDWRSPGGGGGGVSMNKKISCGGNSFPYEGIFFYVGAVISLHVEPIFSMWWVSFSVCFGGYFWSCPPPDNFFAGAHIVVTFFLHHRYLIFSRSWRF